jgi:hypothetical protein
MTSQYGAYALYAGLSRLNACMRMHMSTRPGTHMHAGTHKPICDTYFFSTATMICEYFSVLRDTYIAPIF